MVVVVQVLMWSCFEDHVQPASAVFTFKGSCRTNLHLFSSPRYGDIEEGVFMLDSASLKTNSSY